MVSGRLALSRALPIFRAGSANSMKAGRMKLLHTADWQLGKPFAGVVDLRKRSVIQQERINALHRIADAARNHLAEMIVVAGDLFGDCLPRQSEQRIWLSGSSCLREEVEGIVEDLLAGEED